jgi:hypothetical protein
MFDSNNDEYKIDESKMDESKDNSNINLLELSENGKFEEIYELVKNGFDINKLDCNNCNIFHYVCSFADFNTYQKFITFDINFSINAYNYLSPLMITCYNNNSDSLFIIKDLIINHNQDIYYINLLNKNIFSYIIDNITDNSNSILANNNINILNYLLSYKISVFKNDIITLINDNKYDILNSILINNIDYYLNMTDNNNRTLLRYACDNHKFKIISILLKFNFSLINLSISGITNNFSELTNTEWSNEFNNIIKTPSLATSKWFDDILLSKIDNVNFIQFEHNKQLKITYCNGLFDENNISFSSYNDTKFSLVSSYVIRLKNPCGAKFGNIKSVFGNITLNSILRNPLELALIINNTEIFDSLAIQAIIQHKFNNYAKKIIFLELFIFSLFLLSVVYHSILQTNNNNNNNNNKNIFSYSNIIFSILFGIKELKQLFPDDIWNKITSQDKYIELNLLQKIFYTCVLVPIVLIIGFFYHYKNIWNWLDTFYIIGTIIGMNYDLNNNISDSRTIMSIVSIILWCKLLYYLRCFNHTASFITLLVEALKDMTPFLSVLGIIILAFTHASFIIFNPYSLQYDINNNYKNPFTAIITTYRMLFGDYDYEVFRNNNHYIVSNILFFGFTLIVIIVILNLLISLLGNTFERVHSNYKQWRSLEKTGLISDVDKLFNYNILLDESTNRNSKFFPDWIILATKINK